jgi:hypothetical protein
MDSVTCWNLFQRTGAPVFYLLYREQLAAENAEHTEASA